MRRDGDHLVSAPLTARASRWLHIPDRDIHAFDTRIDPETRLLQETGQQLLADADLLTITRTRATWRAVTRSYG